MKKRGKLCTPFQKRWCRKILLLMKHLCIFLFVFNFGLNAAVHSQNQRVSIELKNASIEDLIVAIKSQCDMGFLYDYDKTKSVKNITVNMQNVLLSEVLSKALLGTGFVAEIENNMIIIKEAPLNQQKEARTVKGRVTDNKKAPLPGVTVLIKGTSIGVVTDADGMYKITLPDQKDITLLFSFIGMVSKEVKVGNQKEINVVLEEDVEKLDEVVVTGYSNIKKSSFTGNATAVTRDELMKTNNKNIISAIQAFDPSFRIRENSLWGSDPNALPEFNIRGESSIGMKKGLDIEQMKQEQHTDLKDNPNLPIFIMDGFEVDVQKVYDMDMNRVESLTILKDAAATAMYGSRAANGVVVITTIAPKPGQLMVSYNGTFSLELPDLSDYNVCNAAEKLELERLCGVYESDVESLATDYEMEYNNLLQQVLRGYNTDWMAQPLRNAFNHKHSIYVEGGVESIRYGVDLKYETNGGVMKDSYRDRMGAGLTLDYRYKKLQIRNYISYNSTRSQDSPYGSFSQYVDMLPYLRIHDDEGKLIQSYSFARRSDVANPLYQATLDSYSGKSTYNELIDNFNINWYLAEGLQFKGQFSITKTDTKTESFRDPRDPYYHASQIFPIEEQGQLDRDLSEGYNWTAKGLFLYNRQFKKHFINATAGIEAVESHSSSNRMTFTGFPMGSVHSSEFAAKQKEKTKRNETNSRLFGLLASVNYSYNDIYLFDGSWRMDGSSQFGADKRFAPFWSVGAGINIHNYNFLKDNGMITLLRIRGSYGSTGKVNFPSYTGVTTYSMDSDAWYYTGPASYLYYLGNEKLKWETTNTLDAGIEFGLWDGILDVKANYYHKETEDMIDETSIRQSSGFTTYYSNAGTVVNKGFEFDLRATLYRDKDWMVTIIGNIATNHNEITKLGKAAEAYNKALDENYNNSNDYGYYADLRSAPLKRYTVGASTTAIYAVRSAGIDPANGKEKFIKKNGTSTYTWDANDQVVVGDETPDAQGAFGFNVSYKGFFLNASFLFQWGGQTYNETLINRVENADITGKNVDKRVLAERWKQPGDRVPYYDIREKPYVRPTSRFVQDYNYLSFNSLSIGYDFPVTLISKWRLASLGLRFNANDLGRWSSVKEERGISYPYAKNYSLTLNVRF